MTLENQVCSLELSKRLKEFGVKQESIFYWNLWVGQMDDSMYQIYYGEPVKRGDGVLSESTYSAFTVAELGELLPEKVYWRGYKKFQDRWYMSFGDFEAVGTTEANMKAIMLMYLLENKLITL